jgi:uncharacterized protein (DUF885 family)
MQPYEKFVDEAFLRITRSTPEMAARMGLATLPQFADVRDKLDDRSVQADFARRDLVDQLFAAHRQYAYQALSASEQLTYDVFEFFLRYLPFEPWAGVAGGEFVLHHYPVRHMWGSPAETFNVLANMHPVRDAADAQAFVARLTQLASATRGLIEGLLHRQHLGLSPPRSALAIVRAELESMIGEGADHSELIGSFAQKLDDATTIAPAQRTSLLAEARKILGEYFQSALRELVECIGKLEAAAAEPLGVWRLPNGDAFYRYSLMRETSTTLKPDEIYALGEAEVARLHGELKHDIAALGFDASDLRGALAAAQRVDQRDAVDTDAQREEIVAYYTHLLDDMRERVRPLFGRFPQARCVVRSSPRHLEARRTTTYFPASSGGEYPGALELCVLREMDKAPWARHALAYHEAWPGHHLQLSVAQEAKHLGLFRRTFVVAGYIEGWAKYAERLPLEAGIDTEPRYELQRKAQELISASNLMLDVGIHDRRWTREQAVAASMEHALLERGMSEYLVDRVSVTPGQTASYMIGLKTVRSLRTKMQRQLGEAFTLPAFHDRLLGEGALPLSVLEQQFGR